MIREKVVITNKHGLHARPAAKFVQIAGRFSSDIKVIKDGLEVNGKSIMGVMMLAAEPGSEIILEVNGEDEKEAFEALVNLIKSNFDEEQ
ncbi:HPr family phosphocarrier protein [Caldithrix abyssi]|uniref:Phosphocarrier protein n=1 Tax=Caldithrix abyssi DSM 13497 TaxID=880073 RepID=H1XXZ0_CALAY|nr:HPr family phosphocarrier protein [Caldithrix abyssi]APF20634.1 phosphocarrier protein [Caldithrix abyssi DSM 13497]EHO40865.1 Phosphotransferase system, phosphocarrier protein HPr [Caldithrix abyssi DSM 13497]